MHVCIRASICSRVTDVSCVARECGAGMRFKNAIQKCGSKMAFTFAIQTVMIGSTSRYIS